MPPLSITPGQVPITSSWTTASCSWPLQKHILPRPLQSFLHIETRSTISKHKGDHIYLHRKTLQWLPTLLRAKVELIYGASLLSALCCQPLLWTRLSPAFSSLFSTLVTVATSFSPWALHAPSYRRAFAQAFLPVHFSLTPTSVSGWALREADTETGTWVCIVCVRGDPESTGKGVGEGRWARNERKPTADAMMRFLVRTVRLFHWGLLEGGVEHALELSSLRAEEVETFVY